MNTQMCRLLHLSLCQQAPKALAWQSEVLNLSNSLNHKASIFGALTGRLCCVQDKPAEGHTHTGDPLCGATLQGNPNKNHNITYHTITATRGPACCSKVNLIFALCSNSMSSDMQMHEMTFGIRQRPKCKKVVQLISCLRPN